MNEKLNFEGLANNNHLFLTLDRLVKDGWYIIIESPYMTNTNWDVELTSNDLEHAAHASKPTLVEAVDEALSKLKTTP